MHIIWRRSCASRAPASARRTAVNKYYYTISTTINNTNTNTNTTTITTITTIITTIIPIISDNQRAGRPSFDFIVGLHNDDML